MADVPGWPVAFRGSRAVAAGLVTRDRPRGPRYQRLLPDVYARACPDPPGLLLRSLAAYRLVEGCGVLSGYSAATLLDAACAPRFTMPAEVTVVGGGCVRVADWSCIATPCTPTRSPASETCGAPLPSARRSTWRRSDRSEAVVAVDRLANRHRFAPHRLAELCARHPGRRGVTRVPDVLTLATP